MKRRILKQKLDKVVISCGKTVTQVVEEEIMQIDEINLKEL